MIMILTDILTTLYCLFPSNGDSSDLFQRREAWFSCARCAATSHLGSIMACTPAKAAR